LFKPAAQYQAQNHIHLQHYPSAGLFIIGLDAVNIWLKFRNRSAQRKWNQEIDQMRRMSRDSGDERFYYSGFAQAVLLDRLSPGWKEALFNDGIWLEDLLRAVVSSEIE
jgi:hypothetical protein